MQQNDDISSTYRRKSFRNTENELRSMQQLGLFGTI
uniref:Uncharacterized protein n=1 Tax=Nothobranchius pienaari TaxID=704102 RepID=A0A1A8L659_9TELE